LGNGLGDGVGIGKWENKKEEGDTRMKKTKSSRTRGEKRRARLTQ